MIFFDLFGTLEQEPCLAGLDHAQIVVAVTAGDGLEADRLQCLHRSVLGILHTHLKTGDFTVVSYLQGITEDGGVTQFFIRGPANCEKVSLIMMTWVMERSSSRNSFAPGMGSIFAIVS